MKEIKNYFIEILNGFLDFLLSKFFYFHDSLDFLSPISEYFCTYLHKLQILIDLGQVPYIVFSQGP